jgi:bifunctional non-homologous end joining protein LigD
MNTSTAVKSVALFFSEGSSDKEYHASIEPSGSGFVVNVAYGRRGSALQTGTKTSAPVDLAKATKVFDKLVAEKTAKGYTSSEGGVAFAGTENAGRVSGMVPQLLNDISEAEAESLIINPAWCAQEKHNGERRMASYMADGPQGVNRKGLFVALPQNIADALSANLAASSEIDSEQVGDQIFVFDLLKVAGNDLRGLGYGERLKALDATLVPTYSAVIVDTAYATTEKRALFDRVKAANGEGIVFKRLDAPFTPGRPNSGGSQLKFKFKASASVFVVAQNDKRSVRMGILDAGRTVEIGNVTIPPSAAIPVVGTIIEVEYLYAYRGGSIFQPVFLGTRGDVDASDCVIEQLKYKPAA